MLKLHSPFVALLSGPWTIILSYNYRTVAAAISHHPTCHSTKCHKSPKTGTRVGSLHKNTGTWFLRRNGSWKKQEMSLIVSCSGHCEPLTMSGSWHRAWQGVVGVWASVTARWMNEWMNEWEHCSGNHLRQRAEESWAGWLDNPHS